MTDQDHRDSGHRPSFEDAVSALAEELKSKDEKETVDGKEMPAGSAAAVDESRGFKETGTANPDLAEQLEPEEEDVSDLAEQLEPEEEDVSDLAEQLEPEEEDVSDLAEQLEPEEDDLSDLAEQLEPEEEDDSDGEEDLEESEFPAHFDEEKAAQILADARWYESAARKTEDLYKKAQLFEESGRIYERRLQWFNRARTMYTESLHADPTLWSARAGLLRLHTRTDTLSEAVDALEKALDFDIRPHERSARLHELGMLRQGEGDTQKALECYESAVKEDAGNISANLAVSIAAVEQNRVDTQINALVNLAGVFGSAGDMSLSAFMGLCCLLKGSALPDSWSAASWSGLESFIVAAAFAVAGDNEKAADILDADSDDFTSQIRAGIIRLKSALYARGAGKKKHAVSLLENCNHPACADLALTTGAGILDYGSLLRYTARFSESAVDDGSIDVMEKLAAFFSWAAGEQKIAGGSLGQRIRDGHAGWFAGALGMMLSGFGASPGSSDVSDAYSSLRMMDAGIASPEHIEEILDREGEDSGVCYELLLIEACAQRAQWEKLARRLEKLVQTTPSANIRWAAAVAMADVYAHRLGQPSRALSRLLASAGGPAQVPLNLYRRLASESIQDLNAILDGEALFEEDELRKAWFQTASGLLAEKEDNESASQAFTRALEIHPLCLGALYSALKWKKKEGKDTARLMSDVISRSGDSDLRASFLVFQGLDYAGRQDSSKAAHFLEDAAGIWPDEDDLKRFIRLLNPAYAPESEAAADASLMEVVQWALSQKDFCSESGVMPESVVKRLLPYLESHQDMCALKAYLEWAYSRQGRWYNDTDEGIFPDSEYMPPQQFADLLAGLDMMTDVRRLDQATARMSSAVTRDAAGIIPAGILAMENLAMDRRKELAGDALFLGEAFKDPGDGVPWLMLAMRLADSYPDLNMDPHRLAAAVIKRDHYQLDAVRTAERGAWSRQDYGELIRLFQRQANVTGETGIRAIFRTRAAELMVRAGSYDKAMKEYREAYREHPLPVCLLLGRIALAIKSGRFRDAAWGYETLSGISAVRELGVDDLHSAAGIYKEKLKDEKGARRCLKRVLELDPSNSRAYGRLARLLGDSNDGREMIEISEKHLLTIREPEERIKLLMNIAEMKFATEKSTEAMENLEQVLLLDPGHAGAVRMLALIHEKNGEWKQMAAVLYRAARECSDNGQAADLYMQMGEICMDRLKDPGMAEEAFNRSLKMKPSMQPMRRLAAIMEKDGRIQQAMEIYGRILHSSATEEERVKWELEIARLVDERIGDPARAEELLKESMRMAPENITPVEALVRLYRKYDREEDAAVFMDAALAEFTPRIMVETLDPDLYHDLFRLFTLKGDRNRAVSAATVAELLDAPTTEEAESIRNSSSWSECSSHVGDPVMDEFICPEEIGSTAREILGEIDAFVCREMSPGIRGMGLSRRDRISDEAHPLVHSCRFLCDQLGLKDLRIYRHPEKKNLIHTISAPSPALIVGKLIADNTDPGYAMFIAARGLKLIQMGMGFVFSGIDADLSLLHGALGMIAGPVDEEGAGSRTEDVRILSEKLSSVIPSRNLKTIVPLIREWNLELKGRNVNLAMEIEKTGNRAGLVASGGLASAIGVLCLLGGEVLKKGDVRESWRSLQRAPGLSDLVSFAVSKEFRQILLKFCQA